MELKGEIKVHNKFEVTVMDSATKETKQTAYAENIVLDAMYAQLCNFSSFFDYMFFGTGTGTLSVSRTSLFARLGYKAFAETDCGTVEEIKNFPTMSRKRKITIQPEEHVGETITEVGIAYGSSISNLVTHAILDTPIIKTATDIVVIEATLYFNFGEWETGFYGGNVKWRPASINDLVTYLFGGMMPSVYFKIGTNPFFSNVIAEGLLATSSAIAKTGWTKDVANKKITTPVTRFAASAGNGAIKTFGLGSSDTKGIFTAILPLTGVFENHAITGEAVGTGDGATTGFDLDWDDIDNISEVYLDGVETTAYTLEKKRNSVFTKLSNPASLPADVGRGAAFSPDGTYLAVAHDSSPCITIYKRDGDVFTKLSNPASLPAGYCLGAAFSPDGTYLAVAHDSSPYIAIYKCDGDVFTKLSNPASLPAGYCRGAAFSPDGTYLAVAHDSSPYIAIYKRDGDVFTKLSNPASLPAGAGLGAAFSPDGTYLAVAHYNSPCITIYKRDGDVFTKLSNPASLPAGYCLGAAFSPDGTYLAVAHSSSPYITIYKRDGDVFTKLSNPASLPAGYCRGAAFSPDGTYLAVAHDSSPYIAIYKRDGDVFTKLSNPASLPAGAGLGAAFSPDGTYLAVAHYNSPYVTIYKTDYYTPSQAHNIEFTTAPAAGVAITADYTIDYIPKDANHVLDLSATIQWG